MPEATCRCGARWSGRRTAHCGSCHLTFGAPGGFDRHRRGGACLGEAALVELGLRRDDRDRWRLPVTETGWTRAAG